MYLGRDFPTFEDGATRTIGFDLTALLDANETISSVASSLVTIEGSDPMLDINNQARFLGIPGFSGATVFQGVSFNDPLSKMVGNTYAITIDGATNQGRTIGPWSRFAIEALYGPPLVPTTSPDSPGPITLPTGALKFVLPTIGGYANEDFPTPDQGETLYYGFDFSPSLAPAEMITKAQAVLRLNRGIDPVGQGNPRAYFVGNPAISGGIVKQYITWPAFPALGSNIYILSIVATTSFGQGLSSWSRITMGMIA